MWRISPTGWQRTELLPQLGHATAIHGTAVVGNLGFDEPENGVVWSIAEGADAAPITLPPLPSGTTTSASSTDGVHIIGSSYGSNGLAVGTLWTITPGGVSSPIALPPRPGDANSYGGLVGPEFAIGGSGGGYVVWPLDGDQIGTPFGLRQDDNGDVFTPVGVHGNLIIGARSQTTSHCPRVAIWTVSGGGANGPYDVTPGGWDQLTATSIDDAGRITAIGVRDGVDHALLLLPTPYLP